ncbi:NAD(+) diphosphatase [Kocuria sp.]|uniref:NAD(+) diphosphatase n=1 Tax=Kocuria sp. TaxID=1871328 RepID=UPI0026DF2AF3|nr:NAD(+) diphosphatase [Kocuria sp.]MDO5617148.1 NAD(+) diphosphatase [Kocuria sp.]
MSQPDSIGLDPASLPLSASALHRHSAERDQADQRPHATHTLVILNGRMPVAAGRLVLVPRADLPAYHGDAAHPEVYLGEVRSGGVTVRTFAQDRDDDAAAAPHAASAQAVELIQRIHRESADREEPLEFSTLRGAATRLSATDPEHAALAVTAQAVTAWHEDHPRCPRCGQVTTVQRSGWMRRCPEDGSLHFPRTDPAIIVAVTDGPPGSPEERLLLGRSAAWTGNRYSTLAGFVEPGESIEQAVVREVQEEAGITVGQVRYLGSQPWPFPRSLMIGCTARLEEGNTQPDGHEIVDLQWFTRAQLQTAAEESSITLPGRISIARALIEHWLGQELPESGW